MKLLASFDKFNEYLDLATGNRLLINNNHKNCGWFKSVIGGISILFVSENNLFLKYNDDCIDVLKISECDITSMSESIALFTAVDSLKNKISFSYEYDKTLHGIAPFDDIDEEDYDWGLFLCNITRDRRRINDIILSRDSLEINNL